MNQDADESSLERTPERPSRSPAEWTTFGIALSILAVVVGLVIHNWLTMKRQPPVLTIKHESKTVQAVQGQFYVPFTVTNTGGETAESVQVIAELQLNGLEESGEQQIDFLAGDETAQGAFVFSRDPRQGELILRVASYKLP